MTRSLLQPHPVGRERAHTSRHRGRSAGDKTKAQEEEALRVWARFVIALGSGTGSMQERLNKTNM